MEAKKPDYVYVTYIATTPEKLWQALMDTDLMAQYLAGDTKMLEGISGGWPKVLSNLKTLLETGHPLPRVTSAT